MQPRRALDPISFAVALSAFALGLSGCYNLPTVKPGPRYIDDFEGDAGLGGSSWSVFGAWTCEAFTLLDQAGGDAGQGGTDAGTVMGPAASPDGGTPVGCTLGPGSTGLHSLLATFDLLTPGDGQQLAVEVVTHTVSGTADFNAFSQLTFDFKLDSSSTTVKLPAGTELQVRLGCSTNTSDQFVERFAPITLDALNWNTVTPPLLLTDFHGKQPVPDSACVAAVDSISFIVLFGSTPPGSSILGTLSLDNVALE